MAPRPRAHLHGLGLLVPQRHLVQPGQVDRNKRFRLDGDAALGSMLTWEAEAASVTNLASPRGFEPLLAA
jgi:hypothetical protein